MTDSALATVRDFRNALHAEGLDEACRFLHEEFALHEAGGLPYSGEYCGSTGFRALLAKMTDAMELTRGAVIEEWARDDSVMVRFSLTFHARASGASVSMPLVELYRVRDERIVELDVYYKDPAAVAALLSPA